MESLPTRKLASSFSGIVFPEIRAGFGASLTLLMSISMFFSKNNPSGSVARTLMVNISFVSKSKTSLVFNWVPEINLKHGLKLMVEEIKKNHI